MRIYYAFLTERVFQLYKQKQKRLRIDYYWVILRLLFLYDSIKIILNMNAKCAVKAICNIFIKCIHSFAVKKQWYTILYSPGPEPLYKFR